ncbi:MAG: kynureninase [Chitinophagaceae bacterium]|nr:kynureninase [Chitinophagaceae bacterium]
MQYQNTLEFAREMDGIDPLKDFRDKFYIPIINKKPCIYFVGNSLGLQPKTTQDYIYNELENWANYGVEAHFHAKIPWVDYHDIFVEPLSKIVGCLPQEVVVMNHLTVNLHLLLTTFYRPAKERFKIICEAKAFPSDQYALESHARLHRLNPDDVIIEVAPREGEYNIRTEDILDTIDKHKNELALVLFGGINYYTGKMFNMKTITEAAHKAGAYCGFDLAHAAGNIELHLHDWDVDFACWCSYKYLNSGPGNIAGAYIHERFVTDTSLPRMAGWWGYDKESRFKMTKNFKPIPTAEGWQLSNSPIISMAAHKSSLDIFEEAGMETLFKKSKLLTGYLLFTLEEINTNSNKKSWEVITPGNEEERGCQVSILMLQKGKEVFDALKKHGVLTDWREPDVIRVAPVPLYNTFEDVYRFAQILKHLTDV